MEVNQNVWLDGNNQFEKKIDIFIKASETEHDKLLNLRKKNELYYFYIRERWQTSLSKNGYRSLLNQKY